MTAARTWVLVAVAAAVVAIGLVVSFGPGGAGGATPDEVIATALARASRGDVDGVVELAGLDEVLDRNSACRDDKARDALRAENAHDVDERVTDHVKTWNDVKTSIVTIARDGELQHVETGAQLGEGCSAKIDFSWATYRVVVKTSVGDRPEKTAELAFELVEVGGRWYLDLLPIGPAGS